MADYDIITVGGGLGGASLAKAMAERGARVMVLERETRFKDRVRGEFLAPWGVAEARALGIYHTLMDTCGHHPRWWDVRLGVARVGERDLSESTPQGVHSMTFYHPEMQEALLLAAQEAGAEVRRGARVRGVQPGDTPVVGYELDGRAHTASARLVVGADGRGSMVRRWGSFEEQRDPDRLFLAGILFEEMRAPEDSSMLVFNTMTSTGALIFPQGGGRARAYFGARTEARPRLQGEGDVPRLIAESVQAGAPSEYYAGARAAGPLATFPGADSWVEHSFKSSIALIGDAAATSDQTWGQGLSMTLRDVRLLRDALLADDDWERAGHAYAEEHDRLYSALHEVEDWFTQLFFEPGPEADSQRAKALPLIARDSSRLHDCFLSGPDCAPVDESARRRFFGEE